MHNKSCLQWLVEGDTYKNDGDDVENNLQGIKPADKPIN